MFQPRSSKRPANHLCAQPHDSRACPGLYCTAIPSPLAVTCSSTYPLIIREPRNCWTLPAVASFLCDKAALLGDLINLTIPISKRARFVLQAETRLTLICIPESRNMFLKWAYTVNFVKCFVLSI